VETQSINKLHFTSITADDIFSHVQIIKCRDFSSNGQVYSAVSFWGLEKVLVWVWLRLCLGE